MTSPPPKEPHARAIWFLDNIQRFLYADIRRLLPTDDPDSAAIRALCDRWTKELAALSRRISKPSGE